MALELGARNRDIPLLECPLCFRSWVLSTGRGSTLNLWSSQLSCPEPPLHDKTVRVNRAPLFSALQAMLELQSHKWELYRREPRLLASPIRNLASVVGNWVTEYEMLIPTPA